MSFIKLLEGREILGKTLFNLISKLAFLTDGREEKKSRKFGFDWNFIVAQGAISLASLSFLVNPWNFNVQLWFFSAKAIVACSASVLLIRNSWLQITPDIWWKLVSVRLCTKPQHKVTDVYRGEESFAWKASRNNCSMENIFDITTIGSKNYK